MIDVKQAVRIGIEFLNTIYEQGKLTNLLLEEVELSPDEKYWFITFGFDRELPQYSYLQAITGPDIRRAYKIVKIDAEKGQTISMKIRES